MLLRETRSLPSVGEEGWVVAPSLPPRPSLNLQLKRMAESRGGGIIGFITCEK